MKKAIVFLSLIALSCVKKESNEPASSVATAPTTEVSAQNSDALDSATIDKMVQINPAEQWNNGKAYKAGEVVIFNGETWVAIRPGYQNTPPPDEWFWKKVIVAGGQAAVQQAAQVVTVQPANQQVAQPATQPVTQAVNSQPVAQPAAVSTQGTAAPYDLNREYKTGEIVSFNGKNYVARRNVYLNTNPSDNWFWAETR